MFLVLADRPILKAPQAGKQHIDQVVLELVILVSNKGEEVQIPVGVVPPHELKDLRLDHTVGVVLDPPRV